MRIPHLGMLLSVSIALGSATYAQPRDVTLWVTLGDSDEIVEVDAYTFQDLRHIKTGPKPHGLTTSPDGSRVYLTSDRTGNFLVVDARRGEVVQELHLGKDPNQQTMSADGRLAFVPLRGDDQIAVVQIEPLQVLKRLPSAKGPHDAITSGDGTRVYVGAQFGNGVVVIDPARQEVLETIPTPDGVRPMVLTRDGRTMFTALSNLIGFVEIDPSTREVSKKIAFGDLPPGLPQPYLDTYSHALLLARNEQELWVTDCINDLIRVVRVKDRKEVAQIRVGHFPHWFTMRPDGKVVFVSLWYSDVVAAIDVESRKVLKNIQFPRGSGPKRILVAPRPATTSQ